MYCSKCGTKIVLSDAAFCHKCGQRLVKTDDAGASIGGNVTTGGGDFIGRDLINKIPFFNTLKGYININIVIIRISIVLLWILLGMILYQNPEVQRVFSEISHWVEDDPKIPAPEILPTPTPTVDLGGQASIRFIKSVSSSQDACPETDTITVTIGTIVSYCYFVMNTGSVTLTHHTIRDESLDVLVSDMNYTLTPSGTTVSNAVAFTATERIMATTISMASWAAGIEPGHPVITATDTTTVNVVATGSQ